MSAMGFPHYQVNLPWTHLDGQNLTIHKEDTTDEDEEDEEEDANENENDEDERNGGDNNHNKPNPKICQHCHNYVSHFHAENGSPDSFHKAKLDLHHWFREHPFEDSLGLEELTAELSAKSSEVEHLRTQLDITKTTLDAEHQQVIALLGENRHLKASLQGEYLLRDRLRKDLKDQKKWRMVLLNRIDEVKRRHSICHQALIDTRLKLENTRHELENTQQHLARIPPPPHPIEDASNSSTTHCHPSD